MASTARTCTGAAAGSDELWQLQKFERSVKKFLSTATESSNDDAFKDLLLQKPEAAMMVVVNVAVEKSLLQPVHCVTLGYRLKKNFEDIFAAVCRTSSDTFIKLENRRVSRFSECHGSPDNERCQDTGFGDGLSCNQSTSVDIAGRSKQEE